MMAKLRRLGLVAALFGLLTVAHAGVALAKSVGNPPPGVQCDGKTCWVSTTKTDVWIGAAHYKAADFEHGEVTILAYIKANGVPSALVHRLQKQGKCRFVGAGTNVPVFTNSGAKNGSGKYGKFKDTRKTFACYTGKGPSGWQKIFDISASGEKENFCGNWLWFGISKPLISGTVIVVRTFANVRMHIKASKSYHIWASCGEASGSALSEIWVNLTMGIQGRNAKIQQFFARLTAKAWAKASADLHCVDTTPPSCPQGQIGYPQCHVPTCGELNNCPTTFQSPGSVTASVTRTSTRSCPPGTTGGSVTGTGTSDSKTINVTGTGNTQAAADADRDAKLAAARTSILNDASLIAQAQARADADAASKPLVCTTPNGPPTGVLKVPQHLIAGGLAGKVCVDSISDPDGDTVSASFSFTDPNGNALNLATGPVFIDGTGTLCEMIKPTANPTNVYVYAVLDDQHGHRVPLPVGSFPVVANPDPGK